MKYIDADKLIAEIKRLEEIDYPCDTLEQSTGFYDALDRVKSFIGSLQQEQQEVDLEKEIDKYCEPIQAWQIQEAPYTSIENCARHFYELGFNARKEK